VRTCAEIQLTPQLKILIQPFGRLWGKESKQTKKKERKIEI
jgi:hypothetical protein